MLALWQELDLCYNDEWENPKDLARFKKREEIDRVFMFLAGVNAGFDDVKGRVLGRRPLPAIREVFSEVRLEEGRKRVMTGSFLPPAEPESSALAVCGNEGDPDKKSWCDHCKRHRHTKDSCWKLHGKPPNWWPNWKKKQEGGKALNIVTETTAEPPSTSKILSASHELEKFLLLKAELSMKRPLSFLGD